jgi:hypothetical protein
LAGGARFGFDPEARINYGCGAVATLQPLADRIVEAYYGADIAYSYAEATAAGLAGVTRKLCTFPQVATYLEGDPASAESFTCQ